MTVFDIQKVALLLAPMKKPARQAVDPQVVAEESTRLLELWTATPAKEKGTQAVFGEKFGVGGQSAVGQFLRGEVPLSLKAAKGFSKGLGCKISDFSPRLAEMETAWPFELVDQERYEMLSHAMQHKAQVRMDDFITELLNEQEVKANGTDGK